ncbi:MAG: hypothetical protein REI09_12705 [Candidatus Dactylopiibacterium sp.]|nr:hypothetical protein [Candidatus Dactylopiibacterium sp.]
MKHIKSLIVTGSGLALFATSAFAEAPAKVSEEQLNVISAGQTEQEVIQILGQPTDTPRWTDGSQSLVYEIASTEGSGARAYVDLGPDSRVVNVQVGTDSGNAGDGH